MPVDVKDIQKKAEISHSTVSRAVNNHMTIALETVERIQRLARVQGYVTCHEIQGGLKIMAPSLIIGNSFFKPVVEVFLVSVYHDDVNALSVEAAFA